MLDKMELGPVPCDEECQQLGIDYDPIRAKAECRAYVNMLQRVFGDPPEGARFGVVGCQHDFGTYYEACVKYDDEIKEAIDFAYDVEKNLPQYWDEDACVELGLPIGPNNVNYKHDWDEPAEGILAKFAKERGLS